MLDCIDGPTHSYMASSPACFAHLNRLLAYEYSDASLRATHRLTVDTFAVQHPGQGKMRKQIQSTGLHLARLNLQIECLRSPKEANDILLGLGKQKSSLAYLEPPKSFAMTIADVFDYAGGREHSDKVKEWAAATWQDWAAHHNYIRAWTMKWMSC